jgi:hypothetical protein
MPLKKLLKKVEQAVRPALKAVTPILASLPTPVGAAVRGVVAARNVVRPVRQTVRAMSGGSSASFGPAIFSQPVQAVGREIVRRGTEIIVGGGGRGGGPIKPGGGGWGREDRRGGGGGGGGPPGGPMFPGSGESMSRESGNRRPGGGRDSGGGQRRRGRGKGISAAELRAFARVTRVIDKYAKQRPPIKHAARRGRSRTCR